FNSADSACEQLTVAKAQLSVASVVHDPAHAVVDNGSPAPLGTQVHDKATTSGGVSGFAVPAPSFTLYTSNDCTTGGSTVATGGADDGGVRSLDTASLAAGDYSFKASVAGNANYLGDDSDCEPFKVAKAQLSVASVVHDPAHAVVDNGSPAPLGTQVHDKATTSGGVSGFAVPAPSFTLYTSNDCTTGGSAVATGGADDGGVRSLDTAS